MISGTRKITRPKNLILVVILCSVLISSIVLVDIASTGYEYEISNPTIFSAFPETLYFYNISEGVTINRHSFIVFLPVNHSGNTHIIPREVSTIFWFKDANYGSDLSLFVVSVTDNLRNGTFSFNNHDYDQLEKKDSDWWAPSLIHFVFNDGPDVSLVRLGLEVEIILSNINGDAFDNHDFCFQLEINVTYSRWWYNIRLSEGHQMNSYRCNLTQDGLVNIQSLEYGLPHYP